VTHRPRIGTEPAAITGQDVTDAENQDNCADQPPPSIPWEALRDVYLTQLGPLLRITNRYDFEDYDPPDDTDDPAALIPIPYSELGNAEIVCFHVALGAPETDPRTVYATFAAGPRTGGHEVFLVSAMPFPPFEMLIHDKALTGVALSPGVVIPLPEDTFYLEAFTPFTAVLLAPVAAGSIAFPLPNGEERCALRAIPLTEPERLLAASSLPELLHALRRVGALESVNPLRECAIKPEGTWRFWTKARPEMEERLNEMLLDAAQRREKLVSLGAPDEDLEDADLSNTQDQAAKRYVDGTPRAPASREEADAERLRRHNELLADVFTEAWRGLPMPAEPSRRLAIGQVVAITLQTHPVATRLVALAGGVGTLDPFEPDKVARRAARCIHRMHPEADLEALVEAALTGANVGVKQVTADGAVAPSNTWRAILYAICLRLYDPPSLEDARHDPETRAVLEGVSLSAVLFQRHDDAPPKERLAAGARQIALHMLAVFLDMPPEPGSGSGPAPAPARTLH